MRADEQEYFINDYANLTKWSKVLPYCMTVAATLPQAICVGTEEGRKFGCPGRVARDGFPSNQR